MTDLEVRPTGRSAREVLAWSRGEFDPALREAVGSLPESMRVVAGYHIGWCDETGRETEGAAGKAIRPALALLATELAGGAPPAAVPAAVAVELVHNFSLLHDDVMDGDVTRRHRPAAWTVFGTGAAILAGDALLTLALDVLAASGHPRAADGMRLLSAAVQDLVDGQSADMSFERRDDVELAECLRMAESKTGALLGCACAIGGLFGGADGGQVERLREFGRRVGVAFQLVDDLLGIWGQAAVTGKPVYSDLQNRKKSLPVVAALATGTPGARELAALYRLDRPLSGAELVRAAELVDDAGGRSWSQTRADELLAGALSLLDVPPAGAAPPVPAAELAALARLIIRRDR
ncbi:family 2 encapsulin nanocompartment cargo protein polyprenyl transferase [Amycolatopsis nigrescens]|uniref:family 2 encapsulin nanocompartment cargo protein polyprenyl transferase n=1 Tax=Amycolatopsis nigrescens TaxID=381445 RepID=UPI00035D616F|nr:family 2 encapsulin nanocompartment cargo protein polyprenyl transferase [Amycolatopsis nigrescens]